MRVNHRVQVGDVEEMKIVEDKDFIRINDKVD